MRFVPVLLCLLLGAVFPSPLTGQDAQPTRRPMQLEDVFELEFAADPQMSPDGQHIVYVRNFMDIMDDRNKGHLWILRSDGTGHRPLTSGSRSDRSPRWSPGGDRILYVSDVGGSSQIHCYWVDSGHTAELTRLTQSPSSVQWSPDGESIAFSMHVPEQAAPRVKLPAKPKGAEWAEPPKVIDRLRYRADGRGYLPEGYRHLFVIPAEGGTPRQITNGEFDHGGDFCWSADGNALYFSANRHEDADFQPLNSEIYSVDVATRAVTQLTSRDGPDTSPSVSPDGDHIAFVGFDDRRQGYQVRKLYVMKHDGSERRELTTDFDRTVSGPQWSPDGTSILFLYNDKGDTRVGSVSMEGGEVTVLAGGIGGTTLGRPYNSGSFCVGPKTGKICMTVNSTSSPADVAVIDSTGSIHQLTNLNEDFRTEIELGAVEEIWVDSSFDKRPIQAWIVKPPGFDPAQKYPMILEIHGGPFANYGSRFSAECQLYAAAGHVVLYVNPRGSTSYGEEFGNLIHHNYPGEDYDDLMSCVDDLVGRGYIDENRLFVTGGSGGGVLTSWIVGKTDRFRAAVVAKPVINWISFALTADGYNYYSKYWFPGMPWEQPEHYFRRSPLSLVGNVTTPTMLLTGEADLRTPIAESEQYYQALKLRNVETAMVRIPGASHGIAARPSHLMAKVAYVLHWFETHDVESDSTP